MRFYVKLCGVMFCDVMWWI